MTAPAPYCPYGFPDKGQECCGGYCGMDSEDRPPKTYTETEVQALVAVAVERAAMIGGQTGSLMSWERRDTIRAITPSAEAKLAERDAEVARLREAGLTALSALVSARDTIRRKTGATNPAREAAIAIWCEILDVEVIPPEAALEGEKP